MSAATPRTGLLGFGLALGAAGLGTAVGIAADRLLTARSLAEALDTGDDLTVVPGHQLAVVATDGVPLHVEVDDPAPGQDRPAGPVTTVVLSHGYCLTRQSWVFQRRALTAAGYRVVVWDQRGHGLSERGTAESCRIEQLGRDLGSVIDAVAPVGPLALVGHSMGGMAVLTYAGQRPAEVADRVVAVGLVATSPGGMRLADGSGLASLGRGLLNGVGRSVLTELDRRPRFVAPLVRANRELEHFLVNRFAFASPVPREVVRLAADMIMGTNLQVMADFLPAFEEYDTSGHLATLTGIETLVCNGDKDVLTPPAHSDAIVRTLPGAEHIQVTDAGHLVQLEHPDLLNEHLLATLARARRGESVGPPRSSVRRVVTDVARRRRVARERAGLRGRHQVS